MPLNYAAIVPHPPILIPQIGKDNIERIKTTVRSYGKVANELKRNKIDTILIISPHGIIQDEVFSINLNPQYSCDFAEFGDFSTKKKWEPNIDVLQSIRAELETKNMLHLITAPVLDHGTAVPLLTLTEKFPEIKIVPLYYSGLSLRAHYDFGKLIAPVLKNSPYNIAVIASGDLSHALTKDSPAGYSPRGNKFDNKLIELLKSKKPREILKMPPDLIEEAQECGLRSILILSGILSGQNYTPNVLSYEAPFGVGYLLMEFKP